MFYFNSLFVYIATKWYSLFQLNTQKIIYLLSCLAHLNNGLELDEVTVNEKSPNGDFSNGKADTDKLNGNTANGSLDVSKNEKSEKSVDLDDIP